MSKRIVSDPAILSGTPVFQGTRIPLDHILGLIRNGISLSEIAEDHPALSMADIEYARSEAATDQDEPNNLVTHPIQLRRKSRAA
jgi:uncharacterized protein (DUF433 family)